MARPLRLEFRGALYHVTSRGDGQEAIYRDDADRALCLEVLANTVERHNWTVHAWCLMGNHYHLLIETPDGNLARGMRHFNGVYTQRFNRRHGRGGHVFQGRYKAILVQKDRYLLELARYIVLNPVRAGMVRGPKDWPWSSYRATAGLATAPAWLQTDWVLSAFGQRTLPAQARYRAFVADGKNQPSPWGQLKNQIYLGSETFVDKMQNRLAPDKDLSEVPAAQRRRVAKPLDQYARRYRDRDEAIQSAYASGGHGLKAIGVHFGLHYSRVSRIVAAGEKAKGKT
jgi:REP element-mobilizing transposase RayT